MHQSIRLLDELQPLRDPLLIAGFADHTGTTAATTIQYLVEQWDGRLVAEIDPEEFFDFTVRRPVVRLAGDQRVIEWPATRLYIARPPGSMHDIVLLAGVEPALRWRAFGDAVVSALEALGLREVVALSSYPGALPHTRPAPLRLSTRDVALAERFDLEALTPQYEGPTGIVGALQAHLQAAGYSVAHLSTMVPFYVAADPNPGAQLTLIEALDRGLGTSTSVTSLRERAETLQREASEAMAQSEQLRTVISSLEQQFDWIRGAPAPKLLTDAGLPSGAELVTDVERFLSERWKSGGADSGGKAKSR